MPTTPITARPTAPWPYTADATVGTAAQTTPSYAHAPSPTVAAAGWDLQAGLVGRGPAAGVGLQGQGAPLLQQTAPLPPQVCSAICATVLKGRMQDFTPPNPVIETELEIIAAAAIDHNKSALRRAEKKLGEALVERCHYEAKEAIALASQVVEAARDLERAQRLCRPPNPKTAASEARVARKAEAAARRRARVLKKSKNLEIPAAFLPAQPKFDPARLVAPLRPLGDVRESTGYKVFACVCAEDIDKFGQALQQNGRTLPYQTCASILWHHQPEDVQNSYHAAARELRESRENS
jgi:hypothetical protein